MRDLIREEPEEESFSISEEDFLESLDKVEDILEDEKLITREWEDFIVVGDTHGYIDATEVPVTRGVTEDLPMIFLGDYVDRGPEQMENLIYILDLKLEHQEDLILLRGNHESRSMNQVYGFMRAANRIYSEETYERISSFFEKLPIASVINDNYFLVHGGIPSNIEYVDEINELETDEEGYNEILWNDPSDDVKGFTFNHKRGAYKLFGEKAVDEFLERNELEKVVRAHQVFPEGYRYFFDEKLLSIFSVPNYRMGNEGKYLIMKDQEMELIDVSRQEDTSVTAFY